LTVRIVHGLGERRDEPSWACILNGPRGALRRPPEGHQASSAPSGPAWR